MDGRSQWGTGTRETEVRLDGWREGGVRQQRNDGWCRLLDNARKIGKSGDPWYICNCMSFMSPFLFGTVFFRTALSSSGGYDMERGEMPLHDAVGINCKKGATTEHQGSGVKYIA